MASDDVIELGSSDEETEPVPKKKRPPNVMVHIPNKITGVTIRPSKSTTKFNPACLLKGAIGKSVTVTKVAKSIVNPYANQKKVNGKPVKSLPPKRVQIPIQNNVALSLPKSVPISTPIIHKTVLNPLQKTGITVANNAKGNFIPKNRINPVNMAKLMKANITPITFANNTVKQLTTKNITGLPPGITIKRTTPPNSKPDVKRRKISPRVVQMSKIGVSANEVVELDDDEPATSSSSPQWYLRPEDQEQKNKCSDKQKEAINDLVVKQDEAISLHKKDSPAKSQKESEKSREMSPVESEKEQENNKEPEKTNFIEITIEDSPVKPSKHKKGFKVGAEIPITIEDSPAKSTIEKPILSPSSDKHEVSPKDPNRRKKLEYPPSIQLVETVEIEFVPLSDDTEHKEQPTENNKNKTVGVLQISKHLDKDEMDKIEDTDEKDKPKSNETEQMEKCKGLEDKREKLTDKKNLALSQNDDKVQTTDETKEKPKRVAEVVEIVEIEESPVKSPDVETQSTPKKNRQTSKSASKPDYKLSEIETVVIDDKEKEEFHPIYQSFINLCFELENSDDMKKIVEKKIKAYYRQVPKEYTESESFTDMVSSKLMAMKAGPEKMYLYIKDVVDELNLQRKLAKALPVKPAKNEEQEKFLYGEESEFDSKRQRQIRKLEKTLKKLHRAIQKLEEQEVDFDDEEDSVYILTDSEDNTSSKDDRPLDKEVFLQRYKERMVRVHAKLCQLTNTKMPSEARVQIDARPGQPKGPAKRLEKWINKKVPIGTPMPFPDFHDVLRCVREANQVDRLGWNEADIMEEARDLFTRCGKKLQRRRQENEWRLAASRLPTDGVDPAENNTDLKKMLEENKRVAAKKETEVFNKYADRQNQLKLEAVEIGDKEADESPVESDDEETGEDSALNSKEERKERIKRLLQEKSKKTGADKENQPKDDATVDTDHSQTKDSSQKESDTVKNTSDQNKGTIDNNTNEINDPRDPKSPTNKEPIEIDKETESSTKGKDDKIETELKDNISPEKEIPNNSPLKDLSKDKDIQSGSCSDNKDDSKLSDKVHSLSDDSNQVESDIDELHLLQKLYSENELNTSVMDSTDSGTPIAISDSTSANDTSSDEKHTKKSSDVISIENSSYSESEEKKGEFSKNAETDNISYKEASQEIVDINMEIECSNNGVEKKTKQATIEKSNKRLEHVLLASSDEADDPEASHKSTVNDTCINLRDDNISIGETVIETNQKQDSDSDKSDRNANTDSSSLEGMEIGPSENCDDENIVETTSVKSTDGSSVTEITSVKSTDANEEENAGESTSIKSVETIVDVSDTGVKSVESVVEDSEKFQNIEVGNVSESADVRSVETLEEINSDITAKKCVESIDNVTECVKSIVSVEDGNSIETEVNNITVRDEKNTGTVDVETENSGDSIQNCVESMDTSESIETCDVRKVEKIKDSIPEPMDVDVKET